MDQIYGALLTYGSTGVAVAVSLFIGVMQWRRNNALVDVVIKLAAQNATIASDYKSAVDRFGDVLRAKSGR